MRNSHTVLFSAAIGLLLLIGSPTLHGQTPDTFPADFFATAYGRTGSDLKTHLESLIDGHTRLSYTPGVWDAHKDIYEDPENPNNIILFYSGASINKSLQDSGSSSSNYWNREHLWPNSYGIDKQNPRYTDIFNLVPTYKGVNSSRNNKHYDVTANDDPAHPLAPDCRSDSNSWEPADPQKGWAARALFYMSTRYSDLTIVNVSQSAELSPDENKMAQLDVVLDWNRRFLPTAQERAVNQRIYDVYQFNRNPYIDFPEFVDAVWVGHPSWGDWRLTHFTLDELLDEQLSSDAADPDGDGLSNLLEMALYSDPRSAETEPLIGTVHPDGNSVTLSFPSAESLENLNVTLVLEFSEDLETWTEIPLPSATTQVGDNPFQRIRQVTRTMQSGEREFYRLRAFR
jgi:endonuclease I